MAKDSKIRLPSGMGGLTSFEGQTGSYVKLQPMHVIILCVAIAIIIVLLEVGAL